MKALFCKVPRHLKTLKLLAGDCIGEVVVIDEMRLCDHMVWKLERLSNWSFQSLYLLGVASEAFWVTLKGKISFMDSSTSTGSETNRVSFFNIHHRDSGKTMR